MRMPTHNYGLTRAQMLEVALRAEVYDQRTLRKYLKGEHVAPTTAVAIRAALAELGLRDPRAGTTSAPPSPASR